MKYFSAKSSQASHLRRRRRELAQTFHLPENLVGGSLSKTHRRCGKSNCRCASSRGHQMWSITSSHKGKRRVERLPEEWVGDLERIVLETQDYLAAIKEVMAINLELIAQTRAQERSKKVLLAKKVGTKRSTLSAADRS